MSDIPSWAVRGRQVVCVDDAWSFRVCEASGIVPPNRVPMLHEVLTIAEVHLQTMDGREGCFLAFHEVQPFIYNAECFRPIVTIEDDITTYFADLLDVREPVGV